MRDDRQGKHSDAFLPVRNVSVAEEPRQREEEMK